MLEVKDLRIHFRNAPEGRDAVKGVSFSMKEGDILGVVGESGSGKTVTAMAISGLLPENAVDCSGSVCFDGLDLLHCTPEELRHRQGTDLAVVFQEPMTSLDPVMKIGPQVEESLRIHTKKSAEERKALALASMADVELPDPERLYDKYPHELSGGMLQRVMIAAALISEPRLLLADEPTTALDVTIQAQILELLKRINAERGTSILFISHNLNVVRKLCSQIVVMHRGVIVERGSTDQIFYHPQEAYTRRLIDAIPTRTRRIY